MENIKNNIKRYRLAGSVCLLAILVIGINVCFTLYYVNWQNNQLNESYVPRISYDLLRALNQLVVPTVVNPKTGQLYVAQADLVLPKPPQNVGSVGYSFAPPINDLNSEEVSIINQSDLIQAEGGIQNGNSTNTIMNAVPKAQSCARGIQIYFQPQSGQKEFFSKKLSNGKMVYFYEDSLCQDNSFNNYVEQIDSY
ncbi:MAG: hypothetical protein ACREF5_00555 [Candidatus Saccharimonadales bacterium]